MKLPIELNKARKLTDEDVQRICGLYKFGESVSSIAKELGVHRGAIYYHIYKIFFPERHREMVARKVLGNKKYPDTKNTIRERDRLKRLRSVYGIKQVAKHRQEIKDKWVLKNKEKFLETRRKYREKNRKKINENWLRRYHLEKH